MSHVPTYISVTLQFLHHCPKNRKQIKKFLGNVGHAQQNKTDYCFCLDMRKFHSKELFVRPQIDSIFFCPSWPYVSFYLVCISGIVGVFHVFNFLSLEIAKIYLESVDNFISCMFSLKYSYDTYSHTFFTSFNVRMYFHIFI